MTQPKLPWEQEDSQAPVGSTPELAALPVVNIPIDPTAPDATPLKDQVKAAIATTGTAAQRVAVGEVTASIAGQPVAVYTATVSGKSLKIADAKSRAFRTLFQNMGVDLLVALGAVVPMLATMDFTNKAAWIVFGTSVAKTVINVFVSYVSRLAVEPEIQTPVEVAPGTAVSVPTSSAAASATG